MTRVALTVILPLLLPTALYVLWLASFGRADAGAASAWRALPWPWLVIAGVGLTAAVLAAVVEFGGNGNGTYVPPHVENGRIVPGHVVPSAPTPR
jgi:hypothetical protein